MRWRQLGRLKCGHLPRTRSVQAAVRILLCHSFLLLFTAAACASNTHAGDVWVERGLAVTSKSLQATMIGGEFLGDREIAVASHGYTIAYVKTKASLKADENALDLCLIDLRRPTVENCVSHFASVRGLYTQFSPALSPDGQQLGYFAHESGPTKTPGAVWKDPIGETIAIRNIDKGVVRLIKS